MAGDARSAEVTPRDVRAHFDHDGPVVIIDAGRRSTAAWVRERWDGHHLGAEATVWAPQYVAIACTEEARERILREAPGHWIEHASGEVQSS